MDVQLMGCNKEKHLRIFRFLRIASVAPDNKPRLIT
jgi:hypothetical protein